MDEQLFQQFNRRIEEQFAYLCHRLDELTAAIQAFQESQSARLDQHERYHARNEHRWGLVKLAGRYPFRLAAATFAFSCALMALAPESIRWLGRLARDWLNLVLH